MSKKILAAFLIVLCTLCFFTSCSKKSETLTIYTWEGMFPQELLDDFTKETGIEINYVNFDTDETMLAKLEAANGGDYDFVLADDYIIEQAVQKGLILELDKSKISTWNNINPIYQGQYYDPEDKYTVPCGAGIMEIVYRPSAVGFEIKGYKDLWNPKLKGRVGIIENPRVINGMVLKLNGNSFNDTDINHIKEAGEKLNELAPNIRLIKDDYLNEDLVSGEIDAGFIYTAQAVTAALADPELVTVFPQEGLGFGIQLGFIPVNAPHKEAAYKFIEYINRPDKAAQWFDWFGYYCTNKAAEELLDPSIKDYILLPSDLKKSDMEIIKNIPSEVYEVHEQIWTDFRNKCN